MTLTQPKITFKKIIYVYVAWWVLWAMLETYALTTTVGLTLKFALFDSINANLIMALAGYVMYNALRYYQPSPKNGFFFLSGV